MSKSKKFYHATEPQTVRRSTSESNRSVFRLPPTLMMGADDTEPPTNEESSNILKQQPDDQQQHPPLMRKKSHFFQAHHRDVIDATPTIEFSPSDDDDAMPSDGGGLNRNGGHRRINRLDALCVEERSDRHEETIDIACIRREDGEADDAVSESSIISKRELKKRLARLLLRSRDNFDVDNALPGDQSKKYALR